MEVAPVNMASLSVCSRQTMYAFYDQITNSSIQEIRCLDHEARRGRLLPEDSPSTRLSVSTKVARVAITVLVLNS